MLILSGIAAVILALILNPMKFPKDELGKVIKIPEIRTVTKTVYVNIPGKTIVDTKTIEEIRVIRDSTDTWAKEFLLENNDSLRRYINESDLISLKKIAKKVEECASAAEQLQAEKEALIEDRNVVVDALAEATNQLWQTKLDTPIAPKKLKNGIGASYMILGGSKPIYQLTYEKPLTPAMSLTGGVIWNGRPGVAGGIKIMF